MFIKKLATLLVALTMIGQTAVFAQDVNVKLNGDDLALPTKAYIKDGRTMVPLKMFESFGAVVSWDGDTRTAMVSQQDTGNGMKVIFLNIGSKIAFVNEDMKTLDVAAEISNSRTMVPLSFVMQNLGATVTWDASTYTVNITTNN